MAKTTAARRPATAGPRTRRRQAIDRAPQLQGWRTTDEEEIERRRARAASEPIEIAALEPEHPVFGTFRAGSGAGGGYEVEIRSLEGRDNSCGCPDYRVNGLGTCKHVEAVLARVRKKRAARQPNPRAEVFLRRTGGQPEVRVEWPAGASARSAVRTLLAPFFAVDGRLQGSPVTVLTDLARRLAAAPARFRRQVRLSRQLQPWVEEERRKTARQTAREQFLAEVQAGRRSLDVVKLPLYPYQQEGMLHLAFTERALLADEMGLGKTVQAIAACALLKELRGVLRVLVVSPASLKTEWEEQIARFTDLPVRLIRGPRAERLRQYSAGPETATGDAFFYLANYEQILADGEEVVRRLAPDVIILDEAQRIKNWQSKTAQAVKRLASPYAFVLTGTPVENRIDEIYSIVQFLDPAIFGPLFRFNRDFYLLDERGRPAGYKNLDQLHRRLGPVLLRRRKAEVETQLPERTVNHFFVPMEPEQLARYEEYDRKVAQLAEEARHRPLLPEEFDQLQRWLACMRMLCDTPYILDSECRLCPKLEELDPILDEVLADPTTKVLVFSEWQRMLELVRERAEEKGVGFAWHTGSVPQDRRRAEIRRFKDDPLCRLFLSTDSGGVGLNLQAANVVINLDLPWNPARLEQRIARAWRKHQTRPVQVINLVTEDSIEQRMLGLLAGKQTLADAVVDGTGDLDTMPLPSGRAALVQRLDAILGRPPAGTAAAGAEARKTPPPADPLEQLRDGLLELAGERLLHMEVREAPDGSQVVLAVLDRPTAADRREMEARVREHLGGPGGDTPPVLEIVDRAVFAALERLGAAGFLTRAGEGRELHHSPAYAPGREGPAEPAEDAERRARLARAREIFLQGERRVHMAAVLAQGGFPVEALPHLREGLEQVLRGLAHGEGRTVTEPEVVDLDWAEEALREWEVTVLLALTTRLRGGPETLLLASEEEARDWVGRGEALTREIGEALGRKTA
jgi:superfamily II DNA or RNA helicase